MCLVPLSSRRHLRFLRLVERTQREIDDGLEKELAVLEFLVMTTMSRKRRCRSASADLA
jgi:hypothetical protein